MFSPVIKSKCETEVKGINHPFPYENDCQPVQSLFTGCSVEVHEIDAINKIVEQGYGRQRLRNFLKGAKQTLFKSVSRFEDYRLILDLEESFFLLHVLKCLVIKNLDGCYLNSQEILKLFLDIKPNFIYTFIAYQYLRSKNWTIKSGTKFGGDFLIYKWGPQSHHSTFVVLVLTPKNKTTNFLQGFQRVAETSGKELLLLQVHPLGNKSYTIEEYLKNTNTFTVSETIAKRFNLKRNI